VSAIIVVATVIGLVAVFAIWAKRQLLETDTWVETSTELLEDEEIKNAVAGFLVDTLFANVDVQAELEQVLPPEAQALAGPVAGGIRQLADQAAPEALGRPRVQQLWEETNRVAHETFIDVVEGNTETDVTLDLGTIVEDLGTRTGIDVAGRLPEDAAQLEVLRADQLSAAQDGVDLFRTIGYIVTFLVLALYVLAIYLAAGWRREATRAVGFGLLVLGAVVLLLRGIAGDLLVDSLTTTAASGPAVSSTWAIGTSVLAEGGVALIIYGLAIVIGAWLAGPGRLATDARRAITPILSDRRIGYAVLAAIILLLVLWAPTEGFTRLLPALVLIGMMVAGFEGLRRVAVAQFPEETWERASARWSERLTRRRGRQGSP
jgi:hypothetical protein